jgi:hypothetical protein
MVGQKRQARFLNRAEAAGLVKLVSTGDLTEGQLSDREDLAAHRQ